jgi:hypothetical protein
VWHHWFVDKRCSSVILYLCMYIYLFFHPSTHLYVAVYLCNNPSFYLRMYPCIQLCVDIHHKTLIIITCSWFPWMHLHNEVYDCQSQSYITTDSQLASLSLCQAPPGAQDQMYVTVRQLRVCWCGTPSHQRGWVCRLQLLLALVGAVVLGSKSCGTHDHFLLSELRLPQPGGPGPHIYIPQEQGGPIISPDTGFPFDCFLWLAGLKVFELISTWACDWKISSWLCCWLLVKALPWIQTSY